MSWSHCGFYRNHSALWGELENCADNPQTFSLIFNSSTPGSYILNNGTMIMTNFWTLSHSTVFDNYGILQIPTSITITSSSVLNNYNTYIGNNINVSVSGHINNHADINSTGSIIVNSSSSMTNHLTGVHDADRLDINGLYTNQGRVQLTDDFRVRSNKQLIIDGGCINSVDWSLQGTITGLNCGTITATNSTYVNNTSALIEGNVAIVDITPPLSAPFVDFNSGTIEPSVTWVSCGCPGEVEDCNNNIDDNGDGRVDEAYPANVQDNLILWLKADVGFSPLLWEDQSQYGNDATVVGNPSLVSIGQNFNQTIEFDGDDAVFSNLPQLVFDDPDQHVTIFCVYTPANSSNTMGIYGNQGGGLNNIVIYDGGFGNGNFTNTPIPELYGAYTHLTSIVLDEEDNVGGSPSSSEVFVNGESVHTFLFDENLDSGVNNNFYLGSSGTNGASQYFTGQISELIVYHNNLGSESVTEADRQKIQSYLALKYGITLPHDYVGSQ